MLMLLQLVFWDKNRCFLTVKFPEKDGLDAKLNERRKEVHVLLQAIHGLEQKMRRVEAENAVEIMDITMDDDEEED